MYDLQKWKLITNVSKIPDKLLVLISELCA